MKKLLLEMLILRMLTFEFVLGTVFLTFLLPLFQVLCLSMLSIFTFVWGLRISDYKWYKFRTKQASVQGRFGGSYQSIPVQTVGKIFSHHLLNSCGPRKAYRSKPDNNSSN